MRFSCGRAEIGNKKVFIVSLHGAGKFSNVIAEKKYIESVWAFFIRERVVPGKEFDEIIIGGDLNLAKFKNDTADSKLLEEKRIPTIRGTSIQSDCIDHDGIPQNYYIQTRDGIISTIDRVEVKYPRLSVRNGLEYKKTNSGRPKYKSNDIAQKEILATRHAIQETIKFPNAKTNEQRLLVTELNSRRNPDQNFSYSLLERNRRQNNINEAGNIIVQTLYDLIAKHRVDYNFVKALTTEARLGRGLHHLNKQIPIQRLMQVFSLQFQKEMKQHSILTGNRMATKPYVGMRTFRVSNWHMSLLENKIANPGRTY